MAAAVSLLGVADADAAARSAGPSLAVRAPSPSAGGRLTVPVPRRGRVDVYLAARRAGGRVWLGGGRAGVRAGVRLRVPAELQAGGYRVLVCARSDGNGRACRRAARVTVARGAPPVPERFTAGARTIGDQLYPRIGNGGFDALRYRLALAYVPARHRLHGRATMIAAARQDLRSLSLDLQGLTVRRVTVDDRPAFFRRHRTKLLITPVAGIRAGSRMRVTVTYGGVVRPVHEPSGEPTGMLPTRSGAVVTSEPIGAQNWFPSNNTPADKARFDVRMRVPTGLEVLGNGRLASKRRTSAGTTFRWVESRPMATYLATATLGRYEIVHSRTPCGLPLYSGIDTAPGAHGAPSARLQARRRALLSRVGPDIARLAQLVGRYPFGSAGGIVVNAPDFDDALETQTRPVYEGEFDPETQIHELSHQWFGDDVTVTRWRDIWLQEGFATWMTWWAQHAFHHRAPTTAQAAARVYRRSERVHGRLRAVWQPVILTHARDLFGDAVYERGGMLLEVLRERVGNATFRRIVRTWLAEHRYANATTADFVALSERVSGRPLGDLFDDWLYTAGKPTAHVPAAWTQRARGAAGPDTNPSPRLR